MSNKTQIISLTQEEWDKEMKNTSQAVKNDMEVEGYFQQHMIESAKKEGMIPDSDWMKKL